MNRRLLIGMYAALLLGPIVMIMGIVDYTQTKKLLTVGRLVPGTVADTKAVSGRRGATTYHLVVTYKPAEDGPRYQKDFSVSQSMFDSARVGSEVSVRVLPGNPRVSMIGDTAGAQTEKIATGAGVFLFGFAVFFWRRQKLKTIQKFANEVIEKQA